MRTITGADMVRWVAMVMKVLLLLKGVEATTTIVPLTTTAFTTSAATSSISSVEALTPIVPLTTTAFTTSAATSSISSEESTTTIVQLPTTSGLLATSPSSVFTTSTTKLALEKATVATVPSTNTAFTTSAATSSDSSVDATMTTLSLTNIAAFPTSAATSSDSSVEATTTTAQSPTTSSSLATSPSSVFTTSTTTSSSVLPSSSVSSSTSSLSSPVMSPSDSSAITPSSPSSASQTPVAVPSTPAATSRSLQSPPTTEQPSPTAATTQHAASSSTPPATSPSQPSLSKGCAQQNGEGKDPPFVHVDFSMRWKRFCRYVSVFKDLMSRKIPEVRGSGWDIRWEFPRKERIQVVYPKEKCSVTSYFNENAVIKFYVLKSVEDLSQSNTDNEMTRESYTILHGYWKNGRMEMFDKVFADKVTDVQLCGGFIGKNCTCQPAKGLTESQHIGIGIGVALAIVALIVIIIHCFTKYRAGKEALRRKDEGRLIITNAVALEEGRANEALNLSEPPESQDHSRNEPEDIGVNVVPSKTEKSEPVTKAQDEMLLLSAIQGYEDGKKGEEATSDEGPTDGELPLAKPEPDKISVEEPIKPADETEVEDEGTETPGKPEDEGTGTPDDSEEEGIGERKPTFTSSVTILLTPDATSTPTKFEYATEDEAKAAPADTGDESPKPEFSQSDIGDADPSQGAINLGFDDIDVTDQKKKDEEEETKF